MDHEYRYSKTEEEMRQIARERTVLELREVLAIIDSVKAGEPGRLNHPALNGEMLAAGMLAVTYSIFERKLGDVRIEHVIDDDLPGGPRPRLRPVPRF